MSEKKHLRVCYFGTYRAEYSRNQMMFNGLQAQDVDVIVCHRALWHGIEDRVQQASGGWKSFGFWQRVFTTYWQLLKQHRQVGEYDLMILGYPGQFDAFLGRILSWWRRKPLVLDHYMSLYLIAVERGLVAKSPITGRLILLLEKIGLHLPNLLISDTPEYIKYHCQTYNLRPEKICLVPAGADDRIFFPRPEVTPPNDSVHIIYYGTFIPNHGVLTIIRAAHLLRDYMDIQFDLYGDGPERPLAEAMTTELSLDNIHFKGWIEKDRLPIEIAQSHICLGVFGETPQSLMTVQNKIWETAAMQKPIISGDSPTVRREFEHLEDIYLIPRNDPEALADAITQLASNQALRHKLAVGAYIRFQDGHTIIGLGATLRQHFETYLSL